MGAGEEQGVVGPRRRRKWMRKLLYIEHKGASNGIVGPARIGWAEVAWPVRSVRYRGRRFASLKGAGRKSNYYDVETGEHYWISGCRKDGADALYDTDVYIDEDAREAYWTEVRGLPRLAHVALRGAPGKYAR